MLGLGFGFNRHEPVNLRNAWFTSCAYTADNYNSDYDCLVNQSATTGDSYFQANLYTDRARIYDGIGYLVDIAGNSFSTADSAALSISGDIEFVVDVELTSYATGSAQMLATKWNPTAGGRSYIFQILSTGVLNINTSPEGATVLGNDSSVSLTTVASAGQRIKIKANLDVNDGAGNRVAKFYYSTDWDFVTNTGTWTQLGSTITTAGATSIYDSPSRFHIGTLADASFSSRAAGKFYYAEVRNGIDGTAVGIFNPSDVPNYAYGWRSSLGNDWRVNVSTAYNWPDLYKVAPAQLGSSGFYTNARIWGGLGYLPASGTSNRFTTPHSSILNITGDIDIIMQISLADYTPAAAIELIEKGTASSAYRLRIETSGSLGFYINSGNLSTGAVPTTIDGSRVWIRATRAQTSGLISLYNSYDYNPYTRTGNWTLLNSAVVSAGTPIGTNTDDLRIGRSDNLNGSVKYAEVRSGINGTAVATFDPSLVPDLATSWISVTGETWSVVKTTGSDSNDPSRLVWNGTNYVYLPGDTGNYISAPDSAGISITGDISLVWRGSLLGRTIPTANTKLISKVGAALNQESYWIDWSSAGYFVLYTSPDGTTGSRKTYQSTVVIPYSANQDIWLRVDLDVDDGAGNRVARFYYSYDDTNTEANVSWTQLGSTVTSAGTTSIYDNTAPLEIGSWKSGTSGVSSFATYYSAVYNDLHVTKVFEFDANLSGQTGYTDSVSGLAIAINRTTSGRKSSLVDRTLLLFGVDDYMVTKYHPLLARGSSSMTYAVGARRFSTPDEDQTIIRKDGLSAEIEGVITWRTTNVIDAATRNAAGSATNQPSILTDSAVMELDAAVVDRDSNTLYIYQSEEVNSTALTTGTPTGALTDLYIGRSVSSATNYIDAEVSGVSVFRKALSADQLKILKAQLNAT